MKISLIAAVSKNGVIGSKGKIPWYIPIDLKHFKELTMGHHLLMGRKTFDSIGRVLPGRTMLVLTKNKKFKHEDVFVFDDYKKALDFAKKNKEDELFVIGGAEIYQLLLPLSQTLYLTRVYKSINGDVFFPKLNLDEWKEVSSDIHKEITPTIEFVTLERKKKK